MHVLLAGFSFLFTFSAVAQTSNMPSKEVISNWILKAADKDHKEMVDVYSASTLNPYSLALHCDLTESWDFKSLITADHHFYYGTIGVQMGLDNQEWIMPLTCEVTVDYIGSDKMASFMFNSDYEVTLENCLYSGEVELSAGEKSFIKNLFVSVMIPYRY